MTPIMTIPSNLNVAGMQQQHRPMQQQPHYNEQQPQPQPLYTTTPLQTARPQRPNNVEARILLQDPPPGHPPPKTAPPTTNGNGHAVAASTAEEDSIDPDEYDGPVKGPQPTECSNNVGVHDETIETSTHKVD